ncbi:putative DD41D transposase [Trichonephila clavipes]|nr:putative DD41D transposase [Trichonephila clavipes]
MRENRGVVILEHRTFSRKEILNLRMKRMCENVSIMIDLEHLPEEQLYPNLREDIALHTLTALSPCFTVSATLVRCPPVISRSFAQQTGDETRTAVRSTNLNREACALASQKSYTDSTLDIADPSSSCQVIYSQFGLAIHQKDHQARRIFVEWAQNEIAVVPDFHKRILFSDEAHFCLNGYVNKQNCHNWSEANPQMCVETPLHPEKLTVWCALWAGGIIGPYFFKNDEGHNVTVNGDRYRALITNFFIPEFNNHDVQELWFQQDGATCHTAHATIDLLKDTFGDP